MADSTKPIPLLLPIRPSAADAKGELALPRVLQSESRAGGGPADSFLDPVKVEAIYELAAPGRGETHETTEEVKPDQLLALEAADGTTLFIRADKLREDLQRVYPHAVRNGTLDLSVLRDRQAASRGVADWVWSKLSILSMGRDAIIDAAQEQALKWLRDWVGEKAEELAVAGASWLGAKALMWAIESQLADEPGLYRWSGPELKVTDRQRPDGRVLREAANEGPLLVFIHGTGSHTRGGFKDLYDSGPKTDWETLTKPFGERVFGFEHRTFSESPIENALMLAEALPDRARFCLVTHSRGGLVGDLLCLSGLDDALIGRYRHAPPPNVEESDLQRRLREKLAEEEQDQLRRLKKQLEQKNFRIERYVRVACPARGTTLLSDNLDVFLSGLLSLTGKLVGAVTGPGGSLVFSAFKRIVLEIAHRRIDARLVPGIEAMLTDSPLGTLLAHAQRKQRKQGVKMAVIAGDIEGGGFLNRLGVMFTDWMLFDNQDNDLVVDTRSMYGGLAGREKTRALFDQGEEVNHFRYFRNTRTRTALRDWLTADAPETLPAFEPLDVWREPGLAAARQRSQARAARSVAAASNTRPVVILLPGIMGSHLQAGGDRVWFDFFDLVGGGLDKIRYGLPDAAAESLFEKFYGDLADHLEASHAVVPLAYDWRRPIEESATELANVVTQQLAGHPDQPVRLLAHSMGGLVVRAMLAGKPEIWNKIVARPGGRFIMLGTPNNGSHAMVETLLGKSSAVRNLARIDLRHDLQEVLDIVAGFPGALQLLPRPGFADTGQTQATDYLVADLWEEYGRTNQDRWFGNGAVGVPNAGDLQTARRLWEQTLLEKAGQAGPWRHTPISHPERIAYVFGQADNTPCGVKAEGRRLKMIGTPQGDGSVTWSAGRLDFLPEDRYWYIPVSHGDLAGTTEHFPALDDLLQTGSTDKLGRLPVSRGEQRGEETVRIYDAGPVPYPGEEELARSLLGGKPQPRQARIEPRSLRVSVIAMDLRFAQHPVICGHYTGDAISGAEAQIDQALAGGALTKRKRLGKYVGEIGTSAVVLAARTEEEIERGTGRGAVIVGLGEWGRLAVHQVTEAVRAGVLDYLLQQLDRDSENRADADREPREFKLASVLIGYNSTTNISVEASVEAVVRGVCLANRQFQETMGSPLRVGKLEFLELFRDAAITAAVAVRDLPQRLEKDRKQLGTRIEAGTELREGEGVRPRLQVSESFGYWPRLIVTAADRSEDDSEEPDRGEPLPTALAERLKYVLLSERARAEAIVEQRQPGLVEALVHDAIKSVKFDRDISRTLFQLLVPLDLKSVARQTPRLLLAVDGYTANLPWEMLQADDEPLAVRTALVRQLVSTRYRQDLRRAVSKTACVVGDPSTDGYYKYYFGDSGNRGETRLVRLDGAAQEADAVRQTLEKAGYAVQFLQRDASKLDVFNALYREPYRILMIAAHGMYNALRRDGGRRSGVVLSDGIMLTAAELNRMEVVPDVVFLNCCHLGQVDATPQAYNRLAYSISRELIEMGVRCVVAAGWSVNDAAACDFARAFFGALVEDGKPFGESVWIARKVACDGYPDLNTWGAYQAYGDPSYRLDHDERDREESIWKPVSPQELTERLTGLRIAHKHEQAKDHQKTAKRAKELLRGVPPAWQDLPEVQFALGDLYGELGPENFESAQQAYLRAIAEEDMSGRVPLRAIEQLANLEARTGEKKGGKEGLALIDRAITGLTGLLEISMPMTGEKEAAAKTGSAEARRMNVERWSLLGSAWKRKAAVLADDDPQGMLAALEKSRRAYASCEGTTSDEDFNPYAMLNRLQLDGILGGLSANEVSERVHLAGQCARSARQRFARTYSFWDAVMSADAQLAKMLLDRSLPNSAEVLVKTYQEAIERVPKSARELDSTVKQLRLFAKFLRPKDDKSATALDKVAGRLEGPHAPGLPSATPVSPAPDESGPVASAPATTAAPPAAGKRRLSKRKSSAQPKSGRKRTRATRPRKRKPRG